MGLLAGAAAGAAAAGAAAVRGGGSQAPARGLRREGLRDGGPRRAKHGSRRGPDTAGPRLSGSGTKLWSPPPWPRQTSPDPHLFLASHYVGPHLYFFLCLDLVLSSHCFEVLFLPLPVPKPGLYPSSCLSSLFLVPGPPPYVLCLRLSLAPTSL